MATAFDARLEEMGKSFPEKYLVVPISKELGRAASSSSSSLTSESFTTFFPERSMIIFYRYVQLTYLNISEWYNKIKRRAEEKSYSIKSSTNILLIS